MLCSEQLLVMSQFNDLLPQPHPGFHLSIYPSPGLDVPCGKLTLLPGLGLDGLIRVVQSE